MSISGIGGGGGPFPIEPDDGPDELNAGGACPTNEPEEAVPSRQPTSVFPRSGWANPASFQRLMQSVKGALDDLGDALNFRSRFQQQADDGPIGGDPPIRALYGLAPVPGDRDPVDVDPGTPTPIQPPIDDDPPIRALYGLAPPGTMPGGGDPVLPPIDDDPPIRALYGLAPPGTMPGGGDPVLPPIDDGPPIRALYGLAPPGTMPGGGDPVLPPIDDGPPIRALYGLAPGTFDNLTGDSDPSAIA